MEVFTVPDEDTLVHFWIRVRVTILVCSTVSCMLTALLLFLYWFLPRIRRTPGWIVMRAAQMDFAQSVCFICISMVSPKKMVSLALNENGVPWEYILVLFVVFLEVGANMWRVLVHVHLWAIYRNPFKPQRFGFLYLPLVAFVGLSSALCASMGLAQVASSASGHRVISYIQVTACFFFVLPFVIFFILGGGIHVWVRCMLAKSAKSTSTAGRSASISVLARQRVSKHGKAYLILNSVQLLLGFVVVVPSLLTWNVQAYLEQALVVLSCGRPAITFIGWIFVNEIPSLCRGKTRPELTGRQAGSSNRERVPSVVGSATTSQANMSEAGDAAFFPEVGDADAGDMMISHTRSARFVREVRDMRGNGIEEVGFKEELRFELVYDVTYSIGELAQRELATENTAPSSFLNVSMGGASPTATGPWRLLPRRLSPSATQPSGASVLELAWGQQSPGLDLGGSLLGQGALPSATSSRRPRTMGFLDRGGAVPQPKALARSVSEGEEMGRRVSATVSQNSRAVHYGVHFFREIRRAFNITPISYSRSFPNGLNDWDDAWRKKLKESVSEGASGSFFYRVMGGPQHDQISKFIVKQVTWSEMHTLISILPAYTKHIQDQNGRSLIQYFGCHSIALNWQYAEKIYFVVMRNFLPAKPWLAFDLKGATANRRALSAKSLYQINNAAMEGNGTSVAYGTLRDWEWMDIAMSIDIGPVDKATLADMISADARFLGEQGLLDYSLLVGVHRPPKDLSPEEHKARLVTLKAAGGFISLDNQKVYFFGIIDVLEHYSLRWRVQHATLTAGYKLMCKGDSADGISAMDPKDYATRFRIFMVNEVLQLDVEDEVETLRVSFAEGDLGICNGTYRRGGSHGGKSKFHHVGNAAVIFWSDGMWKLQVGTIDNGSGYYLSTTHSRGEPRAGTWTHSTGSGRSIQVAMIRRARRSNALGCCAGCCCRPAQTGKERWQRLWRRRRRGLVRDRIEAERQDHMRRIEELEAQLARALEG